MIGGLGEPVRGGDAKRPVADGVPACVPFIGKGEDKRSGQAHQGGFAQVAFQELGLVHFTVPQGIHPQFPKEQRLVPHQVLQAQQIAAERFQVVQINIEGDKIEEGKV